MVEQKTLTRLVTALQKGEECAAAELYETFQGDIYYYILKTVKDPHLAEDLTQDTFLEILETIDRLKEPAAFVTWSRQIAYHRCTAYFRKRHDLLADENEDGYSVFDAVEEDRAEFIPDEALDQAELRKTVQEMLDRLPEEQRTAIMMRYFDELSVREIAEIQGVSEGTVKSRLNYGRKSIQASVEAYEKKSGVKLRCTGVVPLLLWLFREASATNVGSAVTGTAASVAVVEGTAKGVAGSVGAKVVAAVTASALLVGGAVAILLPKAPKAPEEPVREEKLYSWHGYGEDSAGLHTKRFALEIEEMDDSHISGHLQVSYLYESTHDTSFEGTGTVLEDGTVSYIITYAEPAVVGTIPTFEYSEMTLLYDKETECFTFPEIYEAVLERETVNPQYTVLAKDTSWSGKAVCTYCWPQCSGDHQLTIQVETMTEEEISGKITVCSAAGEQEYATEFTGRGYSTDRRSCFEVAVAAPRIEKVGVVTVAFDTFWLEYDHGSDSFHIPFYVAYDGTYTRELP